MTDRNAIIEDYDNDNEDELDEIKTTANVESDDDNEDSDDINIPRVSNTKVNDTIPKRIAIVQFGEYARVRFSESDCNMVLEKRNVPKVVDGIEADVRESYSGDGYPCSIENVIKFVLARQTKEKILKKQEIKDLSEMKDILRQSNADIKVIAREIVNAIKNNEYLTEVAKEAMLRSDSHTK